MATFLDVSNYSINKKRACIPTYFNTLKTFSRHRCIMFMVVFALLFSAVYKVKKMMKKITSFYKMQEGSETSEIVLSFRSRFFYCAGFLAVFLYSANSNAQFSNEGQVKVSEGTILSVYMDYNNKSTGNFINDGEVHIFENWTNNGIVGFTTVKNGKTFFTGKKEQRIDGSQIADFQNLIFENYSDLMPFKLMSSISVNNKTQFINGIIDANLYNSSIIFRQNAFHTDASDLSFVDGMVQKDGNVMFEFPVGNQLYFRPSYNAAGSNVNDSYTSQYFYKNSNLLHPHTSKEDDIKLINNTEYWNVTRNEGTDQIVLSLTLDSNTTPSEFLNPDDNSEVIIVRWDETLSKWIKEGGVVSDRINEGSKGAGYIKLLTAPIEGVKGYGMFTMALVDKKKVLDDLIVYNAISPNDDGINDSFLIKGISKYPDNTVEIYNRWGVKVFDAKSYNESDNMFRGYSDGRATINRNEKLPTGTYFYIIKYNNGQKGLQKTGYLYINNQ